MYLLHRLYHIIGTGENPQSGKERNHSAPGTGTDEDHVCHQLCLTKVFLVPKGDTGDE